VDGGRREVFAGVCAQVEEDEEIDEDGAEHEDEDPEVVKPETLGLIGVVYPALEGLSVMDSGVKKGEKAFHGGDYRRASRASVTPFLSHSRRKIGEGVETNHAPLSLG
jgi:hypothetical protein